MTDIDTSLAVDANPDVNQGICLAPRLAMAKLNLTLNIIGRQADGYHFLQSLVVFVRLGDALVFTLAKDNTSKDILQLYGYNTKALPSYNDNLVSRSLSLMRSQLVPDLPNYRISLTKRIPSGAGLGGGSADAAATIGQVMQQYPKHKKSLNHHNWHQTLGADLAICLYQKPCLMTGIGESVTPVRLAWDVCSASHVVLVMPRESLTTNAVYDSYRARHANGLQKFSMPLAGSYSDEEWTLARIAGCGNDLLPTAASLCPSLIALITGLQQQPGCVYASMTGSGSALFGLFVSQEMAYHAYKTVIEDELCHWACLTKIMLVP